MPIFEYRCLKCGERFEELETIADRDKPHKCPNCGAMDAERQMSVFAARVSGGASGRSCDVSGST
jgi:putative FmdB family regulatory protein